MTNSPSDADQPVGFFPDQDTNRSCGAYPTDDIAPDPTLAGSRRPTSIDAHANPSLVSSPAFRSPASPDFHDIQDRQKQPLYILFQLLHLPRDKEASMATSSPAYRPCQLETHRRSIPLPPSFHYLNRP